MQRKTTTGILNGQRSGVMIHGGGAPISTACPALRAPCRMDMQAIDFANGRDFTVWHDGDGNVYGQASAEQLATLHQQIEAVRAGKSAPRK